MGQNAGEVVVSPVAFTMIAVHSLSYPTDQVHGVLIGSLNGSIVNVTDALPVCHECPTKPLVESALALSLSWLPSSEDGSTRTIVGWYCVPELIGEENPSAADLKIAAGLEAVVEKPVLVTASKSALEKLAKGDEVASEELLEAFGKDFGKQWKEKLVSSVSSKESSAKAVRAALVGEKCLYDLVDHWLVPSRDWPRPAALQEKIMKHL